MQRPFEDEAGSPADPDEGSGVSRGVQQIAAGPWMPPSFDDEGPAFVSVSKGLLLRAQPLAGGSALLLGPGELGALRTDTDGFLPRQVSWTALTRVRLTVMDPIAVARSASQPRLSRMLVDALDQQLRRQAELAAIGHLRHVSHRTLALLMHLGERYGRVTATGVQVPVAMTHQVIGQLIGASRPTVSLALRSLRDEKLLEPLAEGGWLFTHAAVDTLTATVTAVR